MEPCDAPLALWSPVGAVAPGRLYHSPAGPAAASHDLLDSGVATVPGRPWRHHPPATTPSVGALLHDTTAGSSAL